MPECRWNRIEKKILYYINGNTIYLEQQKMIYTREDSKASGPVSTASSEIDLGTSLKNNWKKKIRMPLQYSLWEGLNYRAWRMLYSDATQADNPWALYQAVL